MLMVLLLVLGVGSAAALALVAMGEFKQLYKTPTELSTEQINPEQVVKVGGLVQNGSVVRETGTLNVSFNLTDNANIVTVRYARMLPDLFREGQGIVATGKVDADGVLIATEVLAKHDENYMPPPVADALKKSAEAAAKQAALEAASANATESAESKGAAQ